MLKTKTGKSLLRVRWGAKRGKGSILRVDAKVRQVVDKLAEFDRRRWVTAVICDAFSKRLFDPSLKG